MTPTAAVARVAGAPWPAGGVAEGRRRVDAELPEHHGQRVQGRVAATVLDRRGRGHNDAQPPGRGRVRPPVFRPHRAFVSRADQENERTRRRKRRMPRACYLRTTGCREKKSYVVEKTGDIREKKIREKEKRKKRKNRKQKREKGIVDISQFSISKRSSFAKRFPKRLQLL